ncbi:YqaJ viral recombinase family protein [Parerythrobacter lacustris]|uniref:YqaJ viral recombinase family protein n=1 Tax=Parerythrobacter lacustris TaxID=2969984 RepID=A0ABT1XP74_9SPHN|nr:YqaJ viral recombinase family protein [Parerythrobacter lacustris]MCR2833463.1 YqaJ viral recombinase family protein [Parerythrobacter lacustris]
MNWRLGKLTGSRVKDAVNLRDGATKAEVWRIAAESIIGSAAIAEGDLSASQVLERGHRLEPVALARFAKETGKKVDASLVGWESDDDTRLAISPDGVICKTEAVEVKCLLSTKHVEALYTRSIPKNTAGYEEQRLHYFIVNPKLRKLHHVFYHPDFPAPLDFFVITATRDELVEEIARYEEAEREVVAKVRDIVNTLTLYGPEEVERMRQVHDELVADATKKHVAGKARVQALINTQKSIV